MKKLLSMFLALITVLTAVFSLTLPVSAESLYIRKIVSVVYDDSGSMDGDKYTYANYAMQAFCGMLNSEDQLYITYMRDSQNVANYDPQKVDLSANGIQNSVNAIKSHYCQGGTPYKAVETAYEKLKSIKDTNPNTQYWLVVISDGEFDKMSTMSSDEKKKEFLNDNFGEYTESVMPNGTNPQITFLGIGDKVIAPDEDQAKGIHTYEAADASEIIAAMSKMADRISGRTRLQGGDIKKLDDKTVQVTSSIPLLNIAVLAQNSNAKIESAVYGNEDEIPISRQVSMSYANLMGGAYLLGDSQTVIGSGTYEITFNKSIDADDIVVLFEPALEMRMKITLNGKELTDFDELDTAMEGDKISVSCAIYEMGTDNAIDPSLMPGGTTFEISVSEDGKVVEKSNDTKMTVTDYVLKQIETKITASVTIKGFNPIEYSEKFTPTEYVPKIVYTVTPSFGNNVKSIKYDNIASNKDVTVCFTVYADGVALTDSNAVKALNPVITANQPGNDGSVTYSNDGKIIFTPNSATAPENADGSYDVEVTCTLSDGTSAKEIYTILLADYSVIPIEPTEAIKKTEFYGNQIGASFYVTKDGVKLDKASVEKNISVVLDKAHEEMPYLVSVSEDGTITVIPYSTDEWKLHFGTWWLNGWRYIFGLSGQDVEVLLNHSYGTAENTLNVVEEDLLYIIFNVAAPIILELIILLVIITYTYCVLAKPKFGNSAAIYSGNLYYDPYENAHVITGLKKTGLARFNKFKYRAKYTTKSQMITAGGIKISAQKGGKIYCHENGPAFRGNISFRPDNTLQMPEDIIRYCREFGVSATIEPFSPIETIEKSSVGTMAPTNHNFPTYYIAGVTLPDEGEPFVIQTGRIFIFLNEA